MSRRVIEAKLRKKYADDAYEKELRSTKITVGMIYDWYDGRTERGQVTSFGSLWAFLIRYAEEK